MKIVQFKNGKYGARRRDWQLWGLEFKFLSRGGFWNSKAVPSLDRDYSFDTIKEVQLIIKKSKEEEERFNKAWNDIGRKVKL